MGNAGDLIKHGLLAEFTEWHSNLINKKLTFFDPFGGRPWQSPIHNTVTQRIKDLDVCPLKSIQEQDIKKYIGSGHIVNQISKKNDHQIQIFSSDRDADARHDLQLTGLNPINVEGANPEDGYSIITSNLNKKKNTLILIDPFYDLENINKNIHHEILRVVKNNHISVALYILYKNEEIQHWHNFQKYHNTNAKNTVRSISLKCEAIENSTINGESKFNSFIILYLHNHYSNIQINALAKNIVNYAKNLQKSIGRPIEFNCQTQI